MIPVSWGELFDRIAVLEIQTRRIADASAFEGICGETTTLNALAAGNGKLDGSAERSADRLRKVSERLLDAEDEIGLHELDRKSDGRSIERARCVCLAKDGRATLKKEISLAMGSRASSRRSPAMDMPEIVRWASAPSLPSRSPSVMCRLAADEI